MEEIEVGMDPMEEFLGFTETEVGQVRIRMGFEI